MRISPPGPDSVGVEIRPAVIVEPGASAAEAPQAWLSENLEVHDLSFHGLCIMASFETDVVLAETEYVELRLTFPDPTRTATLVGFIRNRILDGVRVRYGLEIMAQYTHEARVHEQTLARYVLERMREIFGIRSC